MGTRWHLSTLILLSTFCYGVQSPLGSEYDRIYPHYVKYCATSRLHPHKGKLGGIPGHALVYLKGACKDPTKGASGLKLCDKNSDFRSPDTGVGISVDKGLKNVNFFVIPTLRLFLGTTLKNPPLSFSEEDHENLITEMMQKRVFEGVEFHEDMFPDYIGKKNQEEYIARYTFGTDFALAVARKLYCINVPVIEGIMAEIVDALNDTNEDIASTVGKNYRGVVTSSRKEDKDFHWNGIYDNCTHTVINSFARVGMLQPKATNKPLLSQIWNLALPANTFLDLHEEANETEIDPEEVWENPVKRSTFTKFTWIPQQDGVLVENIDVFRENTVFRKDETLWILPHLFENRAEKLKQLGQNPKFVYLGESYQGFIANLAYYEERFAEGLQKAQNIRKQNRYVEAQKVGKPNDIKSLEDALEQINKSVTASALSESVKKNLKKQIDTLQEDLVERYGAKEYVDFMDKFERFMERQLARVRYLQTRFFR